MSMDLLGPLLLFVVFIVFFMVIPQQKKRKLEKAFFDQLKKGTKVITNGGLHGKVLEINEDGTCVIETMAGKMKFYKTAISVERSKKLNEANAVVTKK